MISLSIIVPAYNEENTIETILTKLSNTQCKLATDVEILVVNDASTDNTADIIRSFISKSDSEHIRLYEHEFNRGKGAALHTGIANAKNQFIIVQDADLEYDPQEIDLLIEPVIKDNADVVYGSRFVSGKPHRILFFWHTIGNKFLTFLSNMFTNLNLTDMETCYKLIRTSILQDLDLKEKRFGFEPEVTAKLAKVPNIKIYEVGISYYGRTYAEGKKINWKDGFRAIYCILRYNLLG